MPKNTDSNIDQDNMNEMNEVNSTVDTDKKESEGNIDVSNSENPEDTATSPAMGDVSEEKDPIEGYKSEVAELKDKYLRLYADFENFRRRTAKEKLEMISGASADMVKSILPIVDDFERAKVSFDSSTEIEALKEGVDLIYTKLYKTLESKGLKPMISKGEAFDVEIHESIAQFPAPSDDLKGKVIDEIEKGYYLNDKVLRYAKVIVGA
ncbi:nucleotide exchange factor GrpE [Dyadobacter sp. 32]|uniref:nucleotide exchange factor GrpE n=1 Tax=Dyadobacter sp. 32 TaxID=538966 RepID=UPI0011ED841E